MLDHVWSPHLLQDPIDGVSLVIRACRPEGEVALRLPCTTLVLLHHVKAKGSAALASGWRGVCHAQKTLQKQINQVLSALRAVR